MSTSKCVGIDLGTTNSVIAMMGSDNKTIICRMDKAGRKTFPSAIVYDKKTKGIKAGQIAFNRRGLVPEPIVSIKSHMGDANDRVTTGPLTLSPVEVSAEVLKEMKAQMETYLHGFPEYADYVVDRAVITIPAHFASNAREATTRAGELAGLKVELTLQEPTAAALYYCFKNGIDNGIFMVYDLGGGTFDVSIVRLDEGEAYVLGIAGNNYLGGDNFDDALARHLLRELRESDEGYDLDDMDINSNEDDRRRFTRLKLSAEVIKKALSSQEEYFESSDGIFEDKDGAKVNLAATVTREDFEDMIRPLIESTLDECHKALREAEDGHGVTLDMIDGVLLVGGSTHIPLVAEIIERNFTSPALPSHTKRPKPLIDEPDMAVGYGAAIAAAPLGFETAHEIRVGSETVSMKTAFEPAYGYGGVSVVKGSLIAGGGHLPDGIYARVTRANGGCEKEYMLNEDGSFTFEDLVAEEEREPYNCEFISGGTVIFQSSFDAAPKDIGIPPVVLSRNYSIEVMDAATGQTALVQLMKKGTPLPCSQEYMFKTNSENPYFVHLRFFEERDFLKQIIMNFDPPAEPGTDIKLSILCDQSSRFTVRAEAGGTVVNAELEPSPTPELPQWDEVDKAIRDTREVIAMMSNPGTKIVAEKKLKRLSADLQNAVEAGDAYKAKELFNDMKSIVPPEDAQPDLKPAKAQFERKVAEVQRLNQESENGSDEITREIRVAASAGYRAYDNNDQTALSKACQDLEEIRELLRPKKDEPEKRPPMWMVCTMFAKETLEIIAQYKRYKQSAGASSSVCNDYDPYAAGDTRACEKIMNECRFMPEDKECVPYMVALREAYPRWEKFAKIIDPNYVSRPIN